MHSNLQLNNRPSDVLFCDTVKLVYKDHHRDQQNVVLIHRWSLYAGPITQKVYQWRPVKCGLYKQVVLIYRWSLEQVWLYLVILFPFCTFSFICQLKKNPNLFEVFIQVTSSNHSYLCFRETCPVGALGLVFVSSCAKFLDCHYMLYMLFITWKAEVTDAYPAGQSDRKLPTWLGGIKLPPDIPISKNYG